MTGQQGTGEPLTILCITGWCRNGSTIIGNILNQAPGVTHVGELHFLWKNAAGQGANSRCGCGRTLTECPLWAGVLDVGRPPGVSLDDFAAEVVRRQHHAVRTRHTWRVLRRDSRRPAARAHAGLRAGSGSPRDADLRAHAELMGQVYRAVAARTGARVIVDTSKMPAEAAVLPWLDGVTTYFIHLVRDPRAVAGSWRQPKDYVHALSARASTSYWVGFNLAAQAITRRYPDRSALIRYEDFIADPAGVIALLLARSGADPAGNPVRGRLVDLGPNHTVTGNPDRFRTGPTTIRPVDHDWTVTLPLRVRLTVLSLSWPLLHRYGYRLQGTFAGRAEPVLDESEREERAVGPGA